MSIDLSLPYLARVTLTYTCVCVCVCIMSLLPPSFHHSSSELLKLVVVVAACVLWSPHYYSAYKHYWLLVLCSVPLFRPVQNARYISIYLLCLSVCLSVSAAVLFVSHSTLRHSLLLLPDRVSDIYYALARSPHCVRGSCPPSCMCPVLVCSFSFIIPDEEEQHVAAGALAATVDRQSN